MANSRVEVALHVYNIMLAENEDQLRLILARSGGPGGATDKVIRRDKAKLANREAVRQRAKDKVAPSFDLTPEQQAIIDAQHTASLRRLGIQPKAETV